MPRDLRRDLLLVLFRGGQDEETSESLEAAREAVRENGPLCHAFLEERLSGPSGELFYAADLAGALELTVRSDPQGALRLARRLKQQIDLSLLVYDMVQDKPRLFELVTPEKAAVVTRLYRIRRAAADLIAAIEDRSPVAQ